jgi:hypothetical protein
MGLFAIPCRTCGTIFNWFSGSFDQRCNTCRTNAIADAIADEWADAHTYKPYQPYIIQPPPPGTTKEYDTSVWDGQRWHQIRPRPMVRGDLTSCSQFPQNLNPPEVRWRSVFNEYLHVKVNYPRYNVGNTLRTAPSYGEWARNFRTIKLMERIAELEKDAAVDADFIKMQTNQLAEVCRQLANVCRAGGLAPPDFSLILKS